MDTFERDVAEIREWFASPRFRGIVRMHSAREVMGAHDVAAYSAAMRAFFSPAA